MAVVSVFEEHDEVSALWPLILRAPMNDPAPPRFGSCCVEMELCHVAGRVVVDIDLDWFANEYGVVEHTLDRLADLVAVCNGPVQALTRSVLEFSSTNVSVTPAKPTITSPITQR